MKELAVVQDFISEDYFTSDSKKESFLAKVLELRKQFEDEDASPLSEWSGVRGALQKELLNVAGLSAQDEGGDINLPLSADQTSITTDFYSHLLHYLGFASVAHTTVGMNADGSEAPYIEFRGMGTDEGSSPLLVVFAKPVADVTDLLVKDDATLLTPVEQPSIPGDAESAVKTTTSAARFLSERFNADNPPELALVLAGNSMLLTQAERWPEGRYLSIDLGLLLETSDTKKGGAVDRFLACASAAAIAPGADGTTWFSSVFEDSVKHTEKVSGDLREAVRTSIEIIANDVVARRRAQGLEPLPAEQAQPLAKQSLRFLYRILFLLYAEASPELQVVQAGTTEYQSGYSLDRLRDLALVPIPSRGQGTHLYESLKVLFDQIQNGHNDLRVSGPAEDVQDVADSESLTFHPLEADLFRPQATAHIDRVKLSNDAMQQVLTRLLLSKEQKNKQRGFISYAELGINQLGRVYEGLMSYTGFFAEHDLFEVAPHGDPSKGSWVVPTDRADHIGDDNFVKTPSDLTGDMDRVVHRAGSFVFRLSGRDRQQSASYYTPEVLTKFTVSQALAELLTDDTKADDILQMTVCEPALGSGAFALEGVRQLAAEYLKRKQDERNEKIDPEAYPRELQKTKAYIALHNVYGVDLNATAVELAEISLWLDTMVAGLAAPWFGLRLRRGNSLIGARRSVYNYTVARDKSYLKSTPARVALDADGDPVRDAKSIYQFLLPAEGWGAAADAKEGRNLAPEAVKALKDWRKTVRLKLSKTQLQRAEALADQVDALWKTALRRLTIAESETRRVMGVWGFEEADPADQYDVAGEQRGAPGVEAPVTRAEVERKLADENGAYRRLRRVMDAWCALWFWPLTETEVKLPSIDEWLETCEQLLGKPLKVSRKEVAGQSTIADVDSWAELNDYEVNQLVFSQAVTDVEKVLTAHPWLRVSEDIAKQQGFFHWELDFATVFQKGGFDLQLGNPPWVRPDWNEADILGDFDVSFALEGKMPPARFNRLKDEALIVQESLREYVTQASYNSANRTFLSDVSTYPIISALRTDLYRCFMEETWSHASFRGAIGLIHPETHFTDDKAQRLRRESYSRLRRHWQFSNATKLFEADSKQIFGIHIYGLPQVQPSFLMAASLHNPETIERSLLHSGEGAEPGLKTADGHWDTSAHAGRILRIEYPQLEAWRDALADEQTPVLETEMLYAVNRSAADVLGKLSRQKRIGQLRPYFSQGWNETTDFNKGRFEKKWGMPDSWADVILQGPNFHVDAPFYKQPNETMKNNGDWSDLDLEKLRDDAVPVTSYKPIRKDGQYDKQYTHWILPNGSKVAARDHYRVAWRSMAQPANVRSLIPAIIPPGSAHLFTVVSAWIPNDVGTLLAIVQGVASSLLCDYQIRSAPKAHIKGRPFSKLPMPSLNHPLLPTLVHRVLRLNCLTDAYADLWNTCVPFMRGEQDTGGNKIQGDHLKRQPYDGWTGRYGYAESHDMSTIEPEWTPNTPLRQAADRRQAQLEIDALVALMLGVTADELCSIYRAQFPVLYKYDTQRDHYDKSGRLVPKEIVALHEKQEGNLDPISDGTYTYQPPFITLDREAAMRYAIDAFDEKSE
ncbi:Eco57I restriction-modification methylase domain-containing protein [Brevibacterium moorei]|uniref:Eco57I restriction-modification methylase domain-containing protein n=1 Tax=Brevibacterium moorei TaxID=2968457 RepID=UPI00211D1504|nr:class I SAM-dependent DNA methyltransferase [Brevibacterium sp. 68QC2CO]MCQ9385742.1 class I SAM-dependent DNA methyltransferase [Brevibacterium sp. 68QC2CO]